MMGNVHESFVKPLMINFNVTSDKPKEFITGLIHELGCYSDEVLGAAARGIIRKRRVTTFPRLADCLEECSQVSNSLRMPDQRRKDDLSHPEWSDGRIKLADRLIQSDLGRRAANEGWILALWDFCRSEQRLPNGKGIGECISKTEKYKRSLADVQSGKCGAMTAALTEFAINIEERRKSKIAIALGGIQHAAE